MKYLPRNEAQSHRGLLQDVNAFYCFILIDMKRLTPLTMKPNNGMTLLCCCCPVVVCMASCVEKGGGKWLRPSSGLIRQISKREISNLVLPSLVLTLRTSVEHLRLKPLFANSRWAKYAFVHSVFPNKSSCAEVFFTKLNAILCHKIVMNLWYFSCKNMRVNQCIFFM